MRGILVLVMSACLLLVAVGHTQSPPASRYRVLTTNKLTTLQREVEKALDEGYRIVASGRPGSAVKVVVLERSPDKRDTLISDSLARELRDQTITSGYRVLPLTVGSTGNFVLDGPCGAVLERSNGDAERHDYRMVEAVHTGNLLKNILDAAADGYRLVVVGTAVGYCALLEREPGDVSGAATKADKTSDKEKKLPLARPDYTQPYVLVATTKTGTLEKEIAQAAAHGYRVQSGTADTKLGSLGNELVYMMERLQPIVAHPDYVLLSTVRSETLERELNEAARRGYRLHPLSLTGAMKSLSGTFETVAVMEKKESPAVEYRVIGNSRAGSFEKELTTAGDEGWEFVALVRSGAFTAVLQRPAVTRGQ